MALASTVPSSFICRRASWATLAAVMPVGPGLALVLSTSPPNMGQSCGGKPWAAAATVTLAPSSREIAPRYLIPKVCHQPALSTAVGFLDTISNGLEPPVTGSAMFDQIALHAKNGLRTTRSCPNSYPNKAESVVAKG